jgi:beta-mannosidase
MTPPDLEAQDWIFSTEVEGSGPHILLLDGVATTYEVRLDDDLLLTCESMFAAHRIELALTGRHRLAIHCHAMTPNYERAGKRARWRPRLVAPQSLRLFRKSFLGHAGGWCPSLKPVGPYRAVRLLPAQAVLGEVTLTTRCDGDDGWLDVRLRTDAPRVQVSCGGRTATLTPTEPGVCVATLHVPNVARWWPHTHGEPVLHDVSARIGDETVRLGRVGFRTIEVDRDTDGDGFGLKVNGVPVFCRGALWTNADLVTLAGDREAYAPLMMLARDAGMNMLRIGGTMTYETRAFFDLADELGLLVWQDFMLANFDYPAADPVFAQAIAREARQVLATIGSAPSLAVLCGGSEVAQQAAMMGLPQAAWSNALFDEVLPQVCAQARPDAPYVPNTPFGGSLPFEPRRSVCHYYGVSAYMRPLDDARQAGVRFAAECLGFANVPDGPVPLDREKGEIAQPLWGERYERDVGATWFFEEVRNHYLRELYGVDPLALCRDAPERYLDMSRALNAELAEGVFGLWRRHGSPTRGGLVWFLRDLHPGAGFGVIDAGNRPKAIWHGLARAFRPVQVLLTDEGLNGMDVHLLNETAGPVAAKLTLVCLRDGAVPVMSADRELTLAPRGSMAIAATDLWGAFFDTAYSYRFGPPSHDVTIATLRDENGATLAQAFHFPLGRGHARHDLGLRAEVHRTCDVYRLAIGAQRFAQSVHVEDPHWRAAEDWFHLPPGEERLVRLIPTVPTPAPPRGLVRAVNGLLPVAYEVTG